MDEAATISAIDLSLPDLVRILGNVGVVHGFYDLVLRAWAPPFGLSEFALRVPRLIAVGLAAELMVAIGRRIGNEGRRSSEETLGYRAGERFDGTGTSVVRLVRDGVAGS